MRSRIKARILVLKIEVKILREYLKNARLSLGMTQEDVAKRIGISTNYYCSIEKGERQQDMKVNTYCFVGS